MANEAFQFKAGSAAAPVLPTTLGKLYRDISVTAFTVGLLDASDPQSYPQQVNPGVSEPWYDISPLGGPNGSISGTVRPTWDNGFLFANGDSGVIDLPAQFRPDASSVGHAEMFWMLIPETTALRRGVGWINTGAGNTSAYGFYFNNVVRQLVMAYDGGSATVTLTSAQFPLNIGGTNYGLFLFCFGRVSDGGSGFLRRMRIYNVATGLFNSYSAASGATSAQSNGNAAFGVLGSLSTTNPPMRAYRARIDDVKTTTGIATSAWFDAICDTEFANNKARTDFNIA